MEQADCVVIGAGVVGLAVARELAMAGREVLILEQHETFGTETSSRNSEVVHAGIYYPTGSLKAVCCVEGKHRLYDYCASHGVPVERCGKLIVASDEAQLATLENIRAQGIANEAGELRWLSAADVAAIEPAVRAVAAVYSETTGVVDSHALMVALLGDIEAAGGWLVPECRVESIAPAGGNHELQTSQMPLRARVVVNCGGLGAPLFAHTTTNPPRAYYARGRYYAYAGANPFSHLIYPVPEPGGLGIHVTLDLSGAARFGPDVAWIDGVDYEFDDSARANFVAAIASYYPDVDETRLHPSYTGIRPKISAPGQPAADFRIDGPGEHGIAGLVHLFGIESPGLTAALALAPRVAAMVEA